jgi:hypothetical protein
MQKCVVLFLVFVAVLILASVSEKKDAQWNTDWKEIAARK